MPKTKPILQGQDKLWKMVPNPCGRPRLYTSPLKLWNKALEYFQWVDDNPWQLKQGSTAKSTRGKRSKDEQNTDDSSMRQSVTVLQNPYTLYGFCAFAGIYKWGDFKANYSVKEGFLEVITAIEDIIRHQQVTGAMLHQFDSNLTARLNGLSEKVQNEVTGANGEPLVFPKLSEEDLALIKKLNERV